MKKQAIFIFFPRLQGRKMDHGWIDNLENFGECSSKKTHKRGVAIFGEVLGT
jgi:hypothetical protein